MRYAHARMKVTFAAVPADRLAWSPSETAKTPLAILSHCVDANQQVAKILRGDASSAAPNWGFLIPDAGEAVSSLDASVVAYEEALDSMTEARFDELADSPAGPTPVSQWMHFIGWHLAEHAAQVDYLQTCWDDQEPRYPEM
jgi:hypothetical protein